MGQLAVFPSHWWSQSRSTSGFCRALFFFFLPKKQKTKNKTKKSFLSFFLHFALTHEKWGGFFKELHGFWCERKKEKKQKSQLVCCLFCGAMKIAQPDLLGHSVSLFGTQILSPIYVNPCLLVGSFGQEKGQEKRKRKEKKPWRHGFLHFSFFFSSFPFLHFSSLPPCFNGCPRNSATCSMGGWYSRGEGHFEGQSWPGCLPRGPSSFSKSCSSTVLRSSSYYWITLRRTWTNGTVSG